MTDKIEIDGIEVVAKAAAHAAIRDAITTSPVIRNRANEIVDKVLLSNQHLIEKAILNAMVEALADPALIGPMVRNALVASGSMMEGQFNAVMKKVGKDLALDRRTLEQLAEQVKKAIREGDEKLGMGLFS